MADPLLARGIRAQVILQGRSLLPEDRFVTTWAFQAPGATADEAAEGQVAADLIEFFNVAAAPSTQQVGVFLGGQIERALCEVRTYQMRDTPPRPVTVTPFSLVGSAIAGMPEEVALCLSFYSVRNLPRQRGRVYLGPIATSSGANSTANGRNSPIASFRQAVRDSAKRLADKDPLARPEWCVLSKAGAQLFPVTKGWVDDAFDVQRRRGTDATLRETF